MALTLQGLDEDVNSLVTVLIPASGEEVHGVVEVKVIMARESVERRHKWGRLGGEKQEKKKKKKKNP